ncbi:exo-alpha-sialidase [Micromonospora deserti]|nr:exo-alpha-sialidase [Micromonospora deserti]
MTFGLLPTIGAERESAPLNASGSAYACRQDIHPQDPNFPGVHVASLAQAPNGDLLYSFYAGSQEGADDVKTYMSRLAAGTNTWTLPEVVFDGPGFPDGNAVLWTDERNGKVQLLFSTIRGSGWATADLRLITSTDNGETWSEPRYVRKEWGWLFGIRPFRMTNGDVIVPIYSEARWASGWYVSTDDLETLTPYPSSDDTTWPRSLQGMIQPATVELDPGHLLAFNRTRDSFIWRTESFDYGRTWTRAIPTTLPNNNSRLALLKLDNGHLILADNPTFSDRTPLRLSLSTDGGITWPYSVDVETEPGAEFSYPYLLQTADNMIHLGYTHRRQSMRHVVFNEEFIRSGADIPSDPRFDVKDEYSNGQLHDVTTCQYAPRATKPNLTPTGLTVTQRKPDQATVTAVITNNGASDARDVTVQFLDGETVIGEISPVDIAQGQSVQVFVIWDTDNIKGEHLITARVDPNHDIAEMNETDNSISKAA